MSRLLCIKIWVYDYVHEDVKRMDRNPKGTGSDLENNATSFRKVDNIKEKVSYSFDE